MTISPVLSMKPHLPPIKTAAKPSWNESAMSYFGGMITLPVLSMYPHFPSFLKGSIVEISFVGFGLAALRDVVTFGGSVDHPKQSIKTNSIGSPANRSRDFTGNSPCQTSRHTLPDPLRKRR